MRFCRSVSGTRWPVRDELPLKNVGILFVHAIQPAEAVATNSTFTGTERAETISGMAGYLVTTNMVEGGVALNRS